MDKNFDSDLIRLKEDGWSLKVIQQHMAQQYNRIVSIQYLSKRYKELTSEKESDEFESIKGAIKSIIEASKNASEAHRILIRNGWPNLTYYRVKKFYDEIKGDD